VSASATDVSVVYVAQANTTPAAADGLVSARFGSDLRVAFAPRDVAATAPAGLAPSAPQEATATSDRAADASSSGGTVVAAVATVDTVELPFGQPVMADDLRGVMPAFITDTVSEEPVID
jgi:hypothetical protein